MEKSNKLLYTTLAIISFSIIWNIQENFISLLNIKGNEETIYWVKTFSIIGLYGFLFQLLLWIFSFFYEKFFTDESKIIGKWYQIFKVYDSNSLKKQSYKR